MMVNCIITYVAILNGTNLVIENLQQELKLRKDKFDEMEKTEREMKRRQASMMAEKLKTEIKVLCIYLNSSNLKLIL
jgi:hypothetical protein